MEIANNICLKLKIIVSKLVITGPTIIAAPMAPKYLPITFPRSLMADEFNAKDMLIGPKDAKDSA